MAELMLSLMNRNAAIGYEAANHYYFSKFQLAEKILNCDHIIEAYRRRISNPPLRIEAPSSRKGLAISS